MCGFDNDFGTTLPNRFYVWDLVIVTSNEDNEKVEFSGEVKYWMIVWNELVYGVEDNDWEITEWNESQLVKVEEGE